MLKKICLYITAFVAIAIYMLSENESFMRYFTEKLIAEGSKPLGQNSHQYGDLYSLCYLKDFKISLQPMTDSVAAAADTTKSMDLWVIGDSYLVPLKPSLTDTILYKSKLNFFYYINAEGGRPVEISLATKRKKVLLIERSERFIREDLSQKKIVDRYLNYLTVNNNIIQPKPVADNPVAHEEHLPAVNFSFKWNKPEVVNQNLETMFYSYNLFTSLKELKASFNYNLFGRANQKVAVAPDKHNLYFFDTVDPSKNVSSFKPLSQGMLDTIVNNMNLISAHYKAAGFDEVIFSFIPNPVTIEDPQLGVYNDLIPAIQNNPFAKFSHIDLYTSYKKEPDPKSLYRRSDTHWNSKGFAVWIKQVNECLQKISVN